MLRWLMMVVIVGGLAYFASTAYQPYMLTDEQNVLQLSEKEQRDYYSSGYGVPVPGRYTQGTLIIK